MILYWSPDYLVAKEDFDTTRKSGWIIDSLKSQPIEGIEIDMPSLLSAGDLCEVHSEEYVEAVRYGRPKRLAESQGFHWDAGLWTMARAHASGVVAALLHALETGENAGSLSSGQHHASYDSGAGFCTFNGIAIAAKRALKAGAKHVLIIDLDAHGAGGTHSLIAGDERIHQLDIAVNPYEHYRVWQPNTHDFIRSAGSYLPALRLRLDAFAKSQEHFDICLYYAGMDPFEDCDIGGLPGITEQLLAEREQLVFDWCRKQRIPVAFGIGGGYSNADFTRDQLVNLHRLTLGAAVEGDFATEGPETELQSH
jgi:acetoin utilization deacetylase AcuC-like enzyme